MTFCEWTLSVSLANLPKLSPRNSEPAKIYVLKGVRNLSLNVFLTGGTGFFGKSLLRFAPSFNAPRSLSYSILSRNPDQFLLLNPEFNNTNSLRFSRGDILDPTSFEISTGSNCVLHAASDSTVGPALAARLRYRQIVEGTEVVLQKAVASGVRRLLFTSSGGVYGSQPLGLSAIHEDYNGMPDPLDVSNVYSVAKRTAEHLCALYAAEYGIEIVVARCFAFVGEDLPLNVHFAIGNFIRDALWSDQIVVKGDGTPIRSYLDQRDLARWLLVIMQEGRAGEAYNVGSDRAISLVDLAYLIRDLVSPQKSVHVLGGEAGTIKRNRYVPDITKAASELGLRPSFSLEQSIMDTVAAHRARKANRK